MVLPFRFTKTDKTIETVDPHDRERILGMVARLDDHFSVEIYKEAYHFDDLEIASKRRELERSGALD